VVTHFDFLYISQLSYKQKPHHSDQTRVCAINIRSDGTTFHHPWDHKSLSKRDDSILYVPISAVIFNFSTKSKRETIWHKMSYERGRFSKSSLVLLCFIDPRVRKFRNEASSCPGIFFSTLSFYYVARSPGSPLPHLLDGHRKLVGRSAIPARSCPGPVRYHWGRIVELEVPPDETRVFLSFAGV